MSTNSLEAGTFACSEGAASGRYSFHRPVLVLVDRAVDLATPLHHTWTYQALAHDCLQYEQNRVTVPAAEPGKRDKVQQLTVMESSVLW